ncbi:MAG: hypothetical protein ACRDV4_01250, partial [Acidimicrobiales bacterium]
GARLRAERPHDPRGANRRGAASAPAVAGRHHPTLVRATGTIDASGMITALPGELGFALVDFGSERGWPSELTERVAEAVASLLSESHNGPVDEAALSSLVKRRLPIRHTRDFLVAEGLASSAEQASTSAWLEGRLAALGATIAEEVRIWVAVLAGSSTRAPARTPVTMRTYLTVAQGPLVAFSAQYSSLREVRPEDVHAQLEPLTGSTRAMTGTALRSLFRTLKARRAIFADPTARLHPGRGPEQAVLGLEPEVRRHLLDSVERVDHRLVVLLIGVHALTRRQVMHLALSDIGPEAASITVGSTRRILDPLTREHLIAWLTLRERRWPRTGNPYVFVNKHTALGLGHINQSVVTTIFAGLPTTASDLRTDRLVSEAASCGGDALHVARLFGLSPRTAMHYCADTTASDRDRANAPEDRSNSRSDRAVSAPRGRSSPLRALQ